MLDHTSIGGFALTICGAFLAGLTKGDIAFTITVVVGMSTLTYNIIRITKEIKTKR